MSIYLIGMKNNQIIVSLRFPPTGVDFRGPSGCQNILAGNKTFWKKKKSSWGQYLQNPYYSSDRNGIRTYNHLVCKWTLNHLQTKWLWVQIPLLSLKLQISRLFRTKSSLTFRQLLECGFTLKCVRDMIITYSL